MESKEVSFEVFPYIRVYKDGAHERLAGIAIAPPGLDPETGVLSKDILIVPKTGVSARIYRPNSIPESQKLPLVLYLHGGAFIISSPADPFYHASLISLVAEAKVIAVSIDYRRAPEHPLPAAYDDSWDAVQWLAAQAKGGVVLEPWLQDHADFDKVFLVGDSGGATMAHHLGLRFQDTQPGGGIKLQGIGMIHPYFWGEKPIGIEVEDPVRKAMVDSWWKFVCTTDKGNDDPLINPFSDDSPGIEGLACERILVFVAGKDILRDRGKMYYERLVASGWSGTAEIVETEGEDHVFHIFDTKCEKAKSLYKRLATFINQ